MTKAFTLIELLVVIAIIGILAAILFPVFAQAKMAAKKTVDMSNMKEHGTATAMYLSDNDDVFPTQSGVAPVVNYWYYNAFVPVPLNWWVDLQTAYNLVSAGQSVDVTDVSRAGLYGGALGLPNNLIQPYTKSLGFETVPGAEFQTQLFQQFGEYTDPRNSARAQVGYSMNGLLSSYSASAVAAPSSVMLWWHGFGSQNYDGLFYTNPFLICPDGSQACRFDPGGPIIDAAGTELATTCVNHNDHGSGPPNGQQSAIGVVDYGTTWAYGHQDNWTYADTHAKSHPTGTGDQKLDPFDVACYDAAGHPNALHGCTNAAVYDQQCQIPIFRPDYEP